MPQVPKFLQRLDMWRLRRHSAAFSAPTKPHFGLPQTTEFFAKALQNASALIEFGAGGSTYMAASMGLPFVSVESDATFLGMMRDKISHDWSIDPNLQHFVHRSIGLTRRWGRPLILETPDRSRLALFKGLSDFPTEAQSLPLERAVVLIDGRFRVACALKSLRALQGRDFLLLVDDFRSRRHYRVISDFADAQPMQGRMAVFRPRQSVDTAALDAAIHQNVLDWR